MELHVLTEMQIFLLSAACGIVAGLVYDLFRILRRVQKNGYAAVFLQDTLFWIVCAGLALWTVFFMNDGQLRFYEFFAMLLGLCLYLYGMSAWVVKLFVCLLRVLKKVLVTVLKLVLFPFLFLLRLFFRPFLRIKVKISRKIVKFRLTFQRFCFTMKRQIRFFRKSLK